MIVVWIFCGLWTGCCLYGLLMLPTPRDVGPELRVPTGNTGTW